MVAMVPMSMSFLSTSPALTPIALARSATVITSEMRTTRLEARGVVISVFFCSLPGSAREVALHHVEEVALLDDLAALLAFAGLARRLPGHRPGLAGGRRRRPPARRRGRRHGLAEVDLPEHLRPAHLLES